MNSLKIASLLAASALASPAANNAPGSNCKAVNIPVTGTAQNKNITGIPTTSLDALVKFFESAPAVTVTGPQTLAGTYCTPTTKNANNDKLEVFFGSITTDRKDWTALGGVGTDFPAYQPDMYSFTQYANKVGYATLAIDRLGTGKSSHPDPVLVVQAPYEIALYNNLAEQLRAGKAKDVPKYNHLSYIGNSYGSQLGAGMADAHPDAYNEFVLTGFTDDFQQDFFGVSMAAPAPAAIVDPARFGTLDPGYLTTSSQTGRTNSFFGSKAQVDYDDQVAALFFQRKDVVSVGQFVSVYGIPYMAPKYTGRVFVLDGANDQAACGPGSPNIGPADCAAEGQPAQTKSIFPMAQYNYKTVARTGHAVQFHKSSQTIFKLAHEFLAGASFMGGPPA